MKKMNYNFFLHNLFIIHPLISHPIIHTVADMTNRVFARQVRFYNGPLENVFKAVL